MFFIGIDGGGTKTRGLLCNAYGSILADYTVGPSNHQMIGTHKTKENLQKLITKLLQLSSLTLSQITTIYFGLSGLDTEADEKRLKQIIYGLCPSTHFILENDLWPILRIGTSKKRGIATIYGTGANVLGIDEKEKIYQLKALDYTLGGIGGGYEIALDALHYAFRSDEGTCPKTALQTQLPKSLGYASMSELFKALHPINTLSAEAYTLLPPLVFKLAEEGDLICRQILYKFAKVHAELINGIIKKCQFQYDFPIICGGSLFSAPPTYFLKVMQNHIPASTSKAFYIIPEFPPVFGALLYALEHSMIITYQHYIHLGIPPIS